MSGQAEAIERLLEVGRSERAREQLRPLLAADPDSAVLCHLLVKVELAEENWPQMLAAADRFAAVAPHSGLPLGYRAMALTNLGALDDAVRAARAGVTLSPDTAWVHYRLAHAAYHHPQGAQEARAAAEQAVRLDPEDADYHFFYGLVVRGRFGDERTARTAYQHALRLQPDHTDAMNNLAVLDLGSGDRGSAVRGFTDAALLAPEDALIGRNIIQTVRVTLLRRRWWPLGVTGGSIVTFTVVDAAHGSAGITALVVGALVLLFWPLLLGVLVRGYPAHLRSTVRRALYRDRSCAVILFGMLTASAAPPILAATVGAYTASRLFLLIAGWFVLWVWVGARRAAA